MAPTPMIQPAAQVPPPGLWALLRAGVKAIPAPWPFSWTQWRFAVLVFIAGGMALGVSFSLNLENPFWAMATAYITAQTSAGAVRTKMLWRFVGTFVGACFAVLVVPVLVNAPPLLVVVLAGWVGTCLAVSLLDNTPRAYAFMLSGYTASLIAFPSVNTPGQVFDIAVARVEEITIGVCCVWLMLAVMAPTHAAPGLRKKVKEWHQEAVDFVSASLHGEFGAQEITIARRRLTRDSLMLEQAYYNARTEPQAAEHGLYWMPTLRWHLRRLPILLAGIADRRHALSASDAEGQESLQDLLNRIATWIAETDGRKLHEPALHQHCAVTYRALLAEIAARQAADAAADGWSALVREGLMARLNELVTRWYRAQEDVRQMEAGLPAPRPPAIASFRVGLADPLLVLIAAAAPTLTIMLTCLFWIMTEWDQGTAAAMMVGIAMSIFARFDNPVPLMNGLFKGAVLACIFAGIYLFAVLPRIDGLPLLLFALGIVYLPVGGLIANPATLPLGLGLALFTLSAMSLQSIYTSDFASFTGSAISLAGGIGFGLMVTRMLRPMGLAWRIKRLLRADRQDLARLAAGRRAMPDLERITNLMLDRFDGISSRVGSADPLFPGLSDLADLRAAVNVMRLRSVLPQLPRRAALETQDALTMLSDWARGRQADRATLNQLDRAIIATGATADKRQRSAALALSGLRLSLFPGAEPPDLPPSSVVNLPPRYMPPSSPPPSPDRPTTPEPPPHHLRGEAA